MTERGEQVEFLQVWLVKLDTLREVAKQSELGVSSSSWTTPRPSSAPRPRRARPGGLLRELPAEGRRR